MPDIILVYKGSLMLIKKAFLKKLLELAG